MLNTALSPPPPNKQSGNPKPIKTPSFRPAMEIASCSQQLSNNPGIRTLPTCSSDITRASSLPVSCRCNLRGCSPVSHFRRISLSQTRIRISNHSHRFTSDAWLGSFQPRCLLHFALGDATVETSDCAGEFSSNVLGSKDAVPQEKGHEETDGETDLKYLADNRMIKICNKLIEVFMVDKPTTTDWRRLLAFSKEWENIRPHFFRHCQERADAENNPEMKRKLLRLGRKLKEIDDDVQRHNELINAIKVEPAEISSIVAKRRKDFTKEFFVHLHTVAESYFENPTERTVLAKLGNDCLATVQAYDSASESIQAVEAAELKLQDIINSPSVDVACRKIDALAEKKQLDSALMLMLTKAWSAAKESNMMKDEVKDILYHLYNTAVGNMQRLVPKEIRILKYLLTIEDPEELLSSLKDAFTPGAEMEGKDVDCLYTTPEQLHTWIRTVVDAYNFSREGTLLREARDLMNPNVIQKLEHLKKLVQDHFL